MTNYNIILSIAFLCLSILIQDCTSTAIPNKENANENDPKTKSNHEPRYLLLAKNKNQNSQYPKSVNVDALGVNDNADEMIEEALNNNNGNQESKVVAFPFTSGSLIDDDGSYLGDIPPKEDMETAENMVFRPLFSYRQQKIQKKKVFSDRNGHISNNNHASATPKPISTPTRPPPPVLVYDKKTGSYYPASSNYANYYPGTYPYFY